MTDAIQATGDLSLVDNFSNDAFNENQNLGQAVDAVEEVPNGFLAFGLAPELLQAVKDLGFTQPTTVQMKTIPLAMQGGNGASETARFIDLMVSSQTGSGKLAGRAT